MNNPFSFILNNSIVIVIALMQICVLFKYVLPGSNTSWVKVTKSQNFNESRFNAIRKFQAINSNYVKSFYALTSGLVELSLCYALDKQCSSPAYLIAK